MVPFVVVRKEAQGDMTMQSRMFLEEKVKWSKSICLILFISLVCFLLLLCFLCSLSSNWSIENLNGVIPMSYVLYY